ncbi:hypothetical protein Sjap_006082 [Stephania japonica]|uniref:Uncharacterized protein n=1 Tax=Stephania japonica TaxID=461633 RepID=A0AAP0K6W5_9MAGN
MCTALPPSPCCPSPSNRLLYPTHIYSTSKYLNRLPFNPSQDTPLNSFEPTNDEAIALLMESQTSCEAHACSSYTLRFCSA